MRHQEDQWTDGQLDDAILTLCDEYPRAPIHSYSCAVEYCRREVPTGTLAALLIAMRDRLRLDPRHLGIGSFAGLVPQLVRVT
jgi:hypothetical protein